MNNNLFGTSLMTQLYLMKRRELNLALMEGNGPLTVSLAGECASIATSLRRIHDNPEGLVAKAKRARDRAGIIDDVEICADQSIGYPGLDEFQMRQLVNDPVSTDGSESIDTMH